MAVNLRPLSLGEILDRTAQLYRENFILFAGIASVYAGVLLVLNLMQIAMAELLRQFHMARYETFATLGYAILIFPVIIICSGAAMAANNRAVAWVNLGEPATIRGAYRSILPRLGRYLWIMAIAMFFAYLPFVVIYAAFFLLLFAVPGFNGGAAHHQGANADPNAAILVLIGAIGILILTFPAMIYAIWMAIRYSLAIPASVVENLKARVAIRRSIELTRGARGRIFVLGLLIAVIQVGLIAITQFPFIMMVFKDIKQHALLPVWVQVAQQIVSFLTTSFIGPMYATGLTLFYYDQRIRKEGFDIEWMMQAAGLTVPASAPQPDRAVGQGFIPGKNAPESARALAPDGSSSQGSAAIGDSSAAPDAEPQPPAEPAPSSTPRNSGNPNE
jgi:Membrane domain of glycerophosphoryl diester phosphodiesterase